ncbi:MAG: coiled-coil domain-containing protein [Armatimonadota bacterium]
MHQVLPICACVAIAAFSIPSAAQDPQTPDTAAEIEALRQELSDLSARLRALQERMQAAQRRLEELEGKRPAEEEALRAAAEAAAAPTPPPSGAEEEALRAAAQAAAGVRPPEEAKPEEVTFKSGAIGQQALNPEISVTGDFIGLCRPVSHTDEHTDFDLRTIDAHIQSYLDPYTRLKSAIEFHEDEVELDEAYLTRFGVSEDLNLTLGKFRQQFGVVNRWHRHALDQADFPLALRSIFGEDGLSQTGLSLDWAMPACGGASQALTVQVTDGSNDRLFRQNRHNVPATLFHYKNYRDLNKDTDLEFGLTGLLGANDWWPVMGAEEIAYERDTRWTDVWGADLSVLWEPTERMRYRNIEGRAELYFVNKGILAPDGSGPDTLRAWGLYTQLQSKISRTKDIGFRFDYYEPDSKAYADMDDLSLAPLAVTARAPSRYLIAPYLTWWQSPWVKFRWELDHEWGHNTGPDDTRVIFQAVFAAGPHKHERY